MNTLKNFYSPKQDSTKANELLLNLWGWESWDPYPCTPDIDDETGEVIVPED